MICVRTFHCTYNEKTIRVKLIGGGPYWALRDICDVLGLENPEKIADSLNRWEIRQDRFNRDEIFINAKGLVSTLILSHSPSALPFYRWMMREKLPSVLERSVDWKAEAEWLLSR